MSVPAPALRLVFVDADPETPDPAAVGELARAAVGGLRAQGETLTPDYTGTKGAAELLLWVVAASTVTQSLMALPDVALKVAQLLTELKKLRGGDAPPPAITIVLSQAQAAPITLPVATTPADAALLEALLASHLPAQVDPAATTVTVQVPPTPPNEL